MNKKSILRLGRKWVPVVAGLFKAAYYLHKLVTEVVNYHAFPLRSQISAL